MAFVPVSHSGSLSLSACLQLADSFGASREWQAGGPHVQNKGCVITQAAPAEGGSENWLFGCDYLGRESNIYLASTSAETAEASTRSLFCYGLFRLHPVPVSISLSGLIIRGSFRLP